MGYKPENTIHDLRSELHAQLLEESAVQEHRISEHILLALLILPLVAASALIPLQQKSISSPNEMFHAAAPAEVFKDEKDIDNADVTTFICSEFCREENRIFHEFCTEACPIEGEGKAKEIEEAVGEREGMHGRERTLSQPNASPAENQTEGVQVGKKPKELQETAENELDLPAQKASPTQTSQPAVEAQNTLEESSDEEKHQETGTQESPPIPEKKGSLEDFGVQAERGAGTRRPHDHVGVYLTSASIGRETKRTQVFEALENSVGNAFVFDVKGSYVYFESTAPLAQEMGLVRPAYDLPFIIQEARNRGLYTIARFIVAKDPSLASQNPATQIQNVHTGRGIGDKWVDPGHDTVLAYNRQILRDVIASGVDEVNFDYIRFPTEYTQRAIGLTGEEKADRIEKFLRMARKTVEELGTGTKLGISTYAILGWNFPVNFEPLGQDIARFAPLVDVISPMAYPSTFARGAYYHPARHPGSRMYYLVYRTLEGYKELLGDDAWKLRPWIQGYYVSAQDMYDQAMAVYDAELCGFTVWSAQNTYEPFFDALERIQVPERCT